MPTSPPSLPCLASEELPFSVLPARCAIRCFMVLSVRHRKLFSDFPFKPQTYAGLDYLHIWGVFSFILFLQRQILLFPGHFSDLPRVRRWFESSQLSGSSFRCRQDLCACNSCFSLFLCLPPNFPLHSQEKLMTWSV